MTGLQNPLTPLQTRRAAAAIVGAVAAAYALAVSENLARLHGLVGANSNTGLSELGHDPGKVWKRWHEGYQQFHALFGVRTPAVLLETHAVAAVVAVVGLFVWHTSRPEPKCWKKWGIPTAVLLAVIAQSACQLHAAWHGSPQLGWAGPYLAAGYIRSIALGAIVLLHAPIARLGTARNIWRGASTTARIAMGGGALFVVLLNAGDIGTQTVELMLRWFENWSMQLAWALIGALVWIVLLSAIAHMAHRKRGPINNNSLLLIALGCIAAGGVLLWLFGGFSVLVVGIGLLLIWFASDRVLKVWDPPPTASSDSGTENATVLAIAAALPPAGIAFILIRTAAEATAVRTMPLLGIVGTALLWMFVAIRGWWLVRLAGNSRGFSPYSAWYLLFATPLAVCILFSAFRHDHDVMGRFGATVGSIGVLFLVLITFVSAVVAARRVSATEGEPAVFRWMHFDRTPVALLLVVWFLVAGTVDAKFSPKDFHAVDVKTVSIHGAALPSRCGPKTLSALRRAAPLPAVQMKTRTSQIVNRFCAWLHRTTPLPSTQPGKPPERPLILVSASGGGVRAAAWTTQVLDCAFLPQGAGSTCGKGRRGDTTDRWPYVFAAEGASGGSVGIASTAAEHLLMTRTTGWPKTRLDHDFVTPMAAYTFLSELPLAAVSAYRPPDSARILERDWAKRFGGTATCTGNAAEGDVSKANFRQLSNACSDYVPLMLLNGTNVGDAARVNVSPLAAVCQGYARGVRDLVDLLGPKRDVPLFTAAFLSARFPEVSPSGHIRERHSQKGDQPDSSDACASDKSSEVNVIDGGLSDNSGTAQLRDLWQVLGPVVAAYNRTHPTDKVRPQYVRIDNAEAAGKAAKLPGKLGVTSVLQLGKVLAASKADRADQYRQELIAELERFRLGNRGSKPIVFQMRQHPGRRLPLGWTLSRGSLDDVTKQFLLCEPRRGMNRLNHIWGQSAAKLNKECSTKDR